MAIIKLIVVAVVILSGFVYVNLSPLERDDVNSRIADVFKKEDTINQTVNNINNTNIDFTIFGTIKNYGRPSTTTEVQVEVPCQNDIICQEQFEPNSRCDIELGDCVVDL